MSERVANSPDRCATVHRIVMCQKNQASAVLALWNVCFGEEHTFK
jgi:hypothetical protein